MRSASGHPKTAGLLFGVCFGFLLQRSGVADHGIIMRQLTLDDFTVVKVMLSAVITGLLLVNCLSYRGLIKLQPKPGGWGMTVPGGLLFGAGFALLGYCPGTLAAAAGQGSLDALFAGVTGIMAGSWLFILLYPALNRSVIKTGYWGPITLPDILPWSRGLTVVIIALLLTFILFLIERLGI